MVRNYFDSLGIKRDDQKKDKECDKGSGKDDDKFPKVHDCYMIYGGPSMRLTTQHHKREH